MPHSVSPEANSPNTATVPDETMADSPVPNGTSQATEDDVAMAEADAPATAPPEEKKEVKLEELFADADSDDEFPSSRPQDTPTSSSPEIATPLSPT